MSRFDKIAECFSQKFTQPLLRHLYLSGMTRLVDVAAVWMQPRARRPTLGTHDLCVTPSATALNAERGLDQEMTQHHIRV